MKRNCLILLMIAGLLLSLCAAVQALDGKEGLKAKLTALRNKKAEMTNEYNSLLHKAALEFDSQITKIKSDYRKAREGAIESKNNRSEELRKDFEGRLKPMLTEEESLVELIGRDAREDFAKTRAMRSAGK